MLPIICIAFCIKTLCSGAETGALLAFLNGDYVDDNDDVDELLPLVAAELTSTAVDQQTS